MKSMTVTIADGVTELLNEWFNTSYPEITAIRQYIPRTTLSELDTTQVFVVPRGVTTEIYTRGSFQYTHTVEIGIQAHTQDVNDSTVVDPISYLVEQIQHKLLGEEVCGITCLECNSVLADDSIFAKEHLVNDNVLTAVLVARFLEV